MKQKLQKLLAAGKTKQVIDHLLEIKGQDADFPNTIIVIAARFAEMEKQQHAGTKSDDYLRQERNQINEALLNAIEQLTDELESTAPPTPPTTDSKTTIQNADKIYNIGHIDNANFDTTKNVVKDNTITAGHDVHISNNIVYGEKKIKRLLTSPPFMPPKFIGREEDLEAVHQKLFSGDTFLMLVNGQGGMGKTSFAAKYWQRYEAEYTHLAFLFVANGITDALLSLSQILHLSFPDTMLNDVRLDILIHTLGNLDKPCLLILDNANNKKDLDAHILALHQCPNCHILLTSRLDTYPADEKHLIKKLPLPLAEKHFKNHYPLLSEAELPLFEEIYTAIDGNTLVLELLAKNLTNFNNKLKKRYTLPQLLEDLQRNLLRLSQSKSVETAYQAKGIGWRTETPEAIISAMYDLSELQTNETALLSIFAVLPAEYIDFDTLENLLNTPTKNQAQIEQLKALEKAVGKEALLSLLVEKGMKITKAETALNSLLTTPTTNFENIDQTLLALAQKGWVEENDKGYKISPVIQAITHHKQTTLLADCRPLMHYLIVGMDNDIIINQGKYEHAAHCAYFAQAMVYALQTHTEYEIARLCQNLGNYHRLVGNLSSVLQAYTQMQIIFKALLDIEPKNIDYQNGLAISYQFLGYAHTALGNLPQALTFYEKYNELSKELHTAYPTNVAFKNSLAISYQKLGSTQIALGNFEQALFFFKELNKLFEELHTAYSTNVEFKHGLAISYQYFGYTHSRLGNLPQELDFYEKYNAINKELHAAYPTNVEFKHGLAISYQFLGYTHSRLGNLEQAVHFFEEFNKLSKELHTTYPKNVFFKKGLAGSYQNLGNTHTVLGNIEQALDFYEEDNRLGKELYTAYPTNVDFKNSLAVSYSQLGVFYRDKKKDKTMARNYFEECHRLYKELVSSSPANVDFQHNLKVTERDLRDL